MAPRKSNKNGWRYSQAKALLIDDIQKKIVHQEMTADVVYLMRPEYQEYPIDKFKKYLAYLRTVAQKKRVAAFEDKVALAKFKLSVENATPARKYPPWGSSEAKILLLDDIEAEAHLKMKPSKLHPTRPEYLVYPLDVFRNHIYDEIRRTKGRSYWLRYKNIIVETDVNNAATI